MYFLLSTGPVSDQSKQSISSLSSGTEVYSKQTQYIPDFAVRCISDVQYMRIRRAHYIAAQRATELERQQPRDSATLNDLKVEDHFSKEWQRATSIDPDRKDKEDSDGASQGRSSVGGGSSPQNSLRPRLRSGTRDSMDPEVGRVRISLADTDASADTESKQSC